MSEAPAELWLRPRSAGRWYHTDYPDEPDAVRYVRADLYEAVVVRLRVVDGEPLAEMGPAEKWLREALKAP